jgi:hypothetical protein
VIPAWGDSLIREGIIKACGDKGKKHRLNFPDKFMLLGTKFGGVPS